MKKGKAMMNQLSLTDQEDRELMKESRDDKMAFDRQRHIDLKRIESEKIQIDKERLQLEKDNMMMQREQIIAQKEQLIAQTSVEKSRIVIMRLEMFKSRQSIKKEYPHVTDEYLNTHFPYPE